MEGDIYIYILMSFRWYCFEQRSMGREFFLFFCGDWRFCHIYIYIYDHDHELVASVLHGHVSIVITDVDR